MSAVQGHRRREKIPAEKRVRGANAKAGISARAEKFRPRRARTISRFAAGCFLRKMFHAKAAGAAAASFLRLILHR